MERSKIIDRMTVRIKGTEYEISNPRGFPVHFGTCEEDATPREVYARHFPPNERDGLEHEKKALFFISEKICGFSQAYAKTAKLIQDDVSLSQEGYALIYTRPRARVWADVVRWHERPIIVMTDSGVKLPDTVLYTMEERDGMTLKKSKFLSHDLKQLDAVVAWLEANGHPWEYM